MHSKRSTAPSATRRSTCYLRFFGFVRKLTAERARYLAHLDGIDWFALVALDPAQPGTIIAVVRFDREGSPNRAEYAVVVADRWQGYGLGLALAWRLIGRRGIGRFFALVLPECADVPPVRGPAPGGAAHLDAGR